MHSLKTEIEYSHKLGVAIGHFNISDLVTLKAILWAAHEVSPPSRKIPVIIGVSEGEREFLGPREIAVVVRELRQDLNWPVFLNADHTHSLAKVEEAARAGFDAILIDGGKLLLAENIKLTKEAVKIVRHINPHILVEGEIGYIGSGSQILKEIPKGAAITEAAITTVDDAVRFVRETGVDMVAPAVGNIHGMFKDAPNPHLFIHRIAEIAAVTKKPLVLHGGSGTPDEDFTKAINAGVRVIHISTELRKAWREGMEAGLKQNPNELAPYKLDEQALERMKEVVLSRLRLFNKL